MKRSAALAPLSRDHHHALDAALRLRRDREEGVANFEEFFEGHGRRHFEIEEELLVPLLPQAMADRILGEHAEIRARAERLPAEPAELGELLTAHVRFEEREAFAALESALPEDRLAELGAAIDAAESA